MPTPQTLMVGPYLLVRLSRQPHLRIYSVQDPEQIRLPDRLATLWMVEAADYGIPKEWRIRCADCTEPPSPSRAESVSKAFYDRDKALRWLRLHRMAKHPEKEAA